jgi:hypothetical protein
MNTRDETLPPELPMYRLHGPFWSAPPHRHGPGPQYFRAGQIIELEGEPNAHMEPVNAAAKARMLTLPLDKRWRAGS